MSKNSEDRNIAAAGVDIHGRLEALDQSVRSVESRLRAVERRLSGKTPWGGAEGEQAAREDAERDIYGDVEEMKVQIANLGKSIDEIKNDGRVKVLTEIGSRITKLENMNKITIGKIKVPIELSGLVAAVVLLATGYLISADKWSVIRSSYYPITIGILFGGVVIARFIITNREPEKRLYK